MGNHYPTIIPLILLSWFSAGRWILLESRLWLAGWLAGWLHPCRARAIVQVRKLLFPPFGGLIECVSERGRGDRHWNLTSSALTAKAPYRLRKLTGTHRAHLRRLPPLSRLDPGRSENLQPCCHRSQHLPTSRPPSIDLEIGIFASREGEQKTRPALYHSKYAEPQPELCLANETRRFSASMTISRGHWHACLLVVVGIGSGYRSVAPARAPTLRGSMQVALDWLPTGGCAPCNPRCFETGQASGPCFLLFSDAKDQDSVRSREPEELLPSPQPPPCRPTEDHCGCHHLPELTTLDRPSGSRPRCDEPFAVYSRST